MTVYKRNGEDIDPELDAILQRIAQEKGWGDSPLIVIKQEEFEVLKAMYSDEDEEESADAETGDPAAPTYHANGEWFERG